MPEISIQEQGNVIVCFHFQQQDRFLVKRFTFMLGTMKVHLCPACAELVARGLLEQLEADQHEPV